MAENRTAQALVLARATVTMEHEGRRLLGDVTGVVQDHDGLDLLEVRHFNGETWPVSPLPVQVTVLERKE